jgi:hypothetical protein
VRDGMEMVRYGSGLILCSSYTLGGNIGSPQCSIIVVEIRLINVNPLPQPYGTVVTPYRNYEHWQGLAFSLPIANTDEISNAHRVYKKQHN